jgi:CRP/FNR family transcriptional regulator
MKNECELCSIKSKAALMLSEVEIARLSDNCALVRLNKGETVIKQGALSTNIVYLRSGLAKIHVSGPYYEQIVRIVKPPSYLALPTTFGDKINQYSVTVIEKAEVCFVDMITFRHLLNINPSFSYEIMIELCRNELEAFYRCANRTQKQIRGKIADVLLEMSDQIYHSSLFSLPVSQAEIGNMIDASRESVSRVLTEFDKEGIIKMKGKRIEIENKNTLLLISSNG